MREPTDSEIIERLETWFKGAKDFWAPHHERFTRIKRFTKSNEPGVQWEKNTWDKRMGGDSKRITLTENLLGPFVNREVNKLKRSNFGIQVKPKDDGTDPETARIRQGLHRGIEQMGGWSPMLSDAADNLVTGGLCATRLLTDFADPKSFRKEIQYLSIEPTRIFHGDGTHRHPDFSDVTDSLIYEPYSKDRFKSEFDLDPDRFMRGNENSPVWGTQKTPWVNEYFFKDETPSVLAMAIDGKERYVSELKELLKNPQALMPLLQDHQNLQLLVSLGHALKLDDLIAKDPKTGEAITRDTTTCQIWWCKLAGKEVLKKEAWPGFWIPNFIGTGRKVVIDGQVFYYGLAEPAMDAQKAHNFAVSAHIERLSYAPKIPIYMPIEGVPKGHLDAWQNINTSAQSVAFYHAYNPNKPDQPVPPPHRENSVQSDPGYLDLRGLSEQGIKGTLGMWESALSAPSDERSGVAIRTRESQADNGNYDWGENLALMAEHMGYVTDELLGKVIDVPTQVRIVGEDDKEEVITAAALEEGEENHNGYFDLNRGKFDILCKLTPSNDTKRDEAVQGMQGLFQSAPEMAEALADFYVQEQDWRLAPEAAKRIKKFLGMKYPGLIEPEQGQPDPAQMMQQMQQMQQQVQTMQQQLQQAQQAVQEAQQVKMENSAIKADRSNDAQRIQIEKFKADTDRMKAQAEMAVKQGQMLLAADDQEHTQTLENAQLVQEAHAQSHTQLHDNSRAVLDAQMKAHQVNQDEKKLGQAESKMQLDHAAKISQQGKPTGATGNSADAGRKTTNP